MNCSHSGNHGRAHALRAARDGRARTSGWQGGRLTSLDEARRRAHEVIDRSDYLEDAGLGRLAADARALARLTLDLADELEAERSAHRNPGRTRPRPREPRAPGGRRAHRGGHMTDDVAELVRDTQEFLAGLDGEPDPSQLEDNPFHESELNGNGRDADDNVPLSTPTRTSSGSRSTAPANSRTSSCRRRRRL